MLMAHSMGSYNRRLWKFITIKVQFIRVDLHKVSNKLLDNSLSRIDIIFRSQKEN